MRLPAFNLVLMLVLATSCGGDSPFERAKANKTDDHSAENKTEESNRGIPLSNPENEMVGLAPLSNLQTLIYQQNLSKYHQAGFTGKSLKIAILDNGFAGLKYSKGTRLPPNTRLIAAPGNAMANTPHGTKLAEIVYAMATGSNYYSASIQGPEMLLLNTNGYTNLMHAVDTVIKEKVDIVLYAQVWEYGGNFDGSGFINKEVNRAIDGGTLWVNAAGNMGQSTWTGPIVTNEFGAVDLPYRLYKDSPNSFIRFTVPQGKTNVKIVLAWNDFTDDKAYKTPQDLNFELLDSKNQVLDGAYLSQTGLERPGKQHSTHAREIIHASLEPGTYKVRVFAASKNFDKNSIMRITVNGLGVRLIERSAIETVLIPADNDNVLTIGASDVDYSGLTEEKPEGRMRSEVKFGNSQVYKGTSAATAIAVGTLSVLSSARRAKFGPLKKAHVDLMIDTGSLQKTLRLPNPNGQ